MARNLNGWDDSDSGLYRSIACPTVPPPPPGDGGDLTRAGGQMYPKSPPGDRRNGQISPPFTSGDHSADWRRSMCPTRVTNLVVKFPTLGQSEAVKSPVVSRGVGWGLQLIGALARAESGVQWIPFVMFFFLFEKIKSPTCPILFKFSGEPCYGVIYSPLYE